MTVNEFLTVIEPSDRILITSKEKEIYKGYVGLMRYHKCELKRYLEANVLKIRKKTEIWHKEWKEKGLAGPFNPEETPDYKFSDMRIKEYYEIHIGESK